MICLEWYWMVVIVFGAYYVGLNVMAIVANLELLKAREWKG